MRMHLRIGLRDGKPTFEEGSTCAVTTLAGPGLLTSKVILVSDTLVIEETKGEGSSTVTLKANEFVGALERLFRPYISMALVASRP